MTMFGALAIKAIYVFLLIIPLLNVSSLPTTIDTMDKWIFPLPVFGDVIYNLSDVIMVPTNSMTHSINGSLVDLDTNTTICHLYSSEVTRYYVAGVNKTCEGEKLYPGLAVITETGAKLYITISERRSSVPPIHNMGEKYIIPEDCDKHQTDHDNSLLIYPAVKNTTVSVCFDRQNGGHLSGKFTPRLLKRFDGTLWCYRANLSFDEIWMINNVSLPGGIELSADNPVGVLVGHFGDSSISSENGQFTVDPKANRTSIIWDIYPPVKFWGRNFILFPGDNGGIQNIFIVAEDNSIVTVNSSNNVTTFNLQGRKTKPLELKLLGNFITITGTSNMGISSLECTRSTSRGTRSTYYEAVDSFDHFNVTVEVGFKGINIICINAMESWALHGINKTKASPRYTDQFFIGNRTVYFATFPDADWNTAIHVNLTSNQCFLQKSLHSVGCSIRTNITTPTNNSAIQKATMSAKFDNSHPTNVSLRDLSDVRSGVIIGAHKNDNVNKSVGGNFSDRGLNGNKTEQIVNGSDVQITGNQKRISYLLTTETDELQSETISTFSDTAATYKVTTTPWSVNSSLTTFSDSHRVSTIPLPRILKDLFHSPKLNERYRTTPSSRTDKSTSVVPAGGKKSMSGTRAEIVRNDKSDIIDKIQQNKSSIRADEISSGSKLHYIDKTGGVNRTLPRDQTDAVFNYSSVIYRHKNTSERNSTQTNNIESNRTHSVDRNRIEDNHLNHTVINVSKHTDVEHGHNTTSKAMLNETHKNTNMSKDIMQNVDGNSKKKIKDTELGVNTNSSTDSMHNVNNSSKVIDPLSNDRFKVVLDIVSTGDKDKNTRLLRYDEKNPSYVHRNDDMGSLEQVGDGKSLVAVIVSLSSALFAVVAIILVFFFIEYFSRRKQIRKTRIRPFLSDF